MYSFSQSQQPPSGNVIFRAEPNGFFYITNRKIGGEIALIAPVLKLTNLDAPAGFCPDAMVLCSSVVPALQGVTQMFFHEFSKFVHADTNRMLGVLEFCMTNLFMNSYDKNNPGHLMMLVQCLGGWWAGVAAQVYVSVLREACGRAAARFSSGAQINPVTSLNMMIGIHAATCKALAASARTPLLPHYPSGSPANPAVILADMFIERFGGRWDSLSRETLIGYVIDWEIPAYMHKDDGSHRAIWLPHRQADRIMAFMDFFMQTPK